MRPVLSSGLPVFFHARFLGNKGVNTFTFYRVGHTHNSRSATLGCATKALFYLSRCRTVTGDLNYITIRPSASNTVFVFSGAVTVV